MCTSHRPSLFSSLMMKDLNENNENDDYSSYFGDTSAKENSFKDSDSESPENIIEKSNDGHYGKVILIYIINQYIV